MQVVLKNFRCINCARLLFKADFLVGKIEIKCRNCKRIILIKSHNCSLLKNLDGGVVLLNNNFLQNKRNIDQALEQCMKCPRLGRCGYYVVIRKLCSF